MTPDDKSTQHDDFLKWQQKQREQELSESFHAKRVPKA